MGFAFEEYVTNGFRFCKGKFIKGEDFAWNNETFTLFLNTGKGFIRTQISNYEELVNLISSSTQFNLTDFLVKADRSVTPKQLNARKVQSEENQRQIEGNDGGSNSKYKRAKLEDVNEATIETTAIPRINVNTTWLQSKSNKSFEGRYFDNDVYKEDAYNAEGSEEESDTYDETVFSVKFGPRESGCHGTRKA